MNTLLHLDSSINARRSLSRQLTAEFVADWRRDHPEGTVLRRDLAAAPVPPLNEHWLEVLAAPPGAKLSPAAQAARAVSDTLIDELLAADAFVFGVPMYNFSVPGAFKNYQDQIARVGRTLRRGPKGLEGQLRGKKLLIVSTRSGDYRPGGPRDGFDFHEPYLRKFFGPNFLGIEDIAYVPVMNNPLHHDAETQAALLAAARAQLRQTAERWKEWEEIPLQRMA